MSRDKPGTLYRSRSLREPVQFGSGLDLTLKNSRSREVVKLKGNGRISSASMDNIIFSRDALEQWLLPTSSGFRRTKEVQCLYLSDDALLKEVIRNQPQRGVSKSPGPYLKCSHNTGVSKNLKQNSTRLSRSGSFELSRRIEIEEIRQTSPTPKGKSIKRPSSAVSGKYGMQPLNVSVLSRSPDSDIQLRRCISLYERDRNPHYCCYDRRHQNSNSPTPINHSSRAGRPGSVDPCHHKHQRCYEVEQNYCTLSVTKPPSPRPGSAPKRSSLGFGSSSPRATSVTSSGSGSSSRPPSRMSVGSCASSSDLDLAGSPKTVKLAKKEGRKSISETPTTKPLIKEQAKKSSIPRPVSLSQRPRSNTVDGSRVAPVSGSGPKAAWGTNTRNNLDVTDGHRPVSLVSKSLPATPSDKTSGQVSRTRTASVKTVNGITEINASHAQQNNSLSEQDKGTLLNGHLIPDVEDGYPEVKPSVKSKHEICGPRDFAPVDAYVEKAPKSVMNSFEALTDYLVEDLTSPLLKVRAIYKWVTSQTLPLTTSPGSKSTDSPRGFLFNIRERKASYAELFALLCRRAGIPCAIISGVAKSVIYHVGDKVSKSRGRNSWNAVYVEDEWRLVHAYWGSHVVSGYRTGRWVEVDNDTHDKTNTALSDGPIKHTTNEFYFLTDPKHFITKSFPDDHKWQLSSSKVTKEQFEALPFVQPAFHELKLSDVIHDSCTVHTHKGVAKFELEIAAKSTKNYRFAYKLYERRDFEAEGEYDAMSLQEYILYYKYNDHVFIQIRFPITGVFKLELHCSDKTNPLASDWICDYKIVCSEVAPNCQPLPLLPNSQIGWGPNETLSSTGIDCLSHGHPEVSLDKDSVTFIRLALPKDNHAEIDADLVTNLVPRDALKSHVTIEQDGEDHVVIQVSPPGEGEYALQVYIKDGQEKRNVLNYLMHRTKIVEDPELADIRRELARATASGDVESLAHWMEKFNEKGMEDGGDLTNAKKRLNLARLDRDIQEAISRRDLDTLERLLHSASSTSLRRRLGNVVTQAEAVRSRLRRIKRLHHEVMEMDQKTISEIRSYPKPPPAVHAVMTATYLLLGNQESELAQWPKIQSLITKRGKESLKKRVVEFNMHHVSNETLSRVHSILSRYDLETVQMASAGAATFYQWSFTMASEVDECIHPTTTV